MATVDLFKFASPRNTSTIKRVVSAIGIATISGMVGDQAAKYAELQVDNAVKAIEDFSSKAKTEEEEKEEVTDEATDNS